MRGPHSPAQLTEPEFPLSLPLTWKFSHDTVTAPSPDTLPVTGAELVVLPASTDAGGRTMQVAHDLAVFDHEGKAKGGAGVLPFGADRAAGRRSVDDPLAIIRAAAWAGKA